MYIGALFEDGCKVLPECGGPLAPRINMLDDPWEDRCASHNFYCKRGNELALMVFDDPWVDRCASLSMNVHYFNSNESLHRAAHQHGRDYPWVDRCVSCFQSAVEG